MLFTYFLREFKTTFNCKISFCYGFNEENEKIATLWEGVLIADTIDLNGGHKIGINLPPKSVFFPKQEK